MKPYEHAKNSAEKFGGQAEDYLDIHELLDSTHAVFPDVRHRAATHNTWFINTIIPKVFGEARKNSAGKEYSVREVAERHVMEDYNLSFVPTLQDFLEQVPLADWMDNAHNDDLPPSRRALKDLAPRAATRQTRVLPKEFDAFGHRDCGGAGMID